MTLLKGVVSSSGTDIPAEDWVLVGSDIATTNGQTSLVVESTATTFCGYRFIADINATGSSTLVFQFGANPTNAVYRFTRAVEGTVSVSQVSPAAPISIVMTPGRILTLGQVWFADIAGSSSDFSLTVQRVVGTNDCELSTMDGFLSNSPTTAAVTITGTHAKGSRLTVYGIPKAVA